MKSKAQQTWRKIKSKLPKKCDKEPYPKGFYPGKFFHNEKVLKLSTYDVDCLTLRPIVPKVGTATYETAKYLTNYEHHYLTKY